MNNPHGHSRWIKPTFVGMLSLGVFGAPLRLTAQALRPSTAPAGKKQSSAGNKVAPDIAITRPALATVATGKFKIAVDAVRRPKGKQLSSLKQSGFPVVANFSTNRNESSSTHGASNRSSGSSASGGYRADAHSGRSGAGSGSGGYGSSGGSGGSGAGGWSSGADGTMNTANLVIDLQVSGPRNSPHRFLCTVIGKVQATDDLGNAIDAPDLPAHLKMELSGFDYPQDSGCAAVHLNLNNKEARSIKSLHGDLLVIDTRVQTTTFEAEELHGAFTRPLNGVTVRLNKVESTEDGINVSAGVSMPDPFTDKLNFHNMQNRLRVVLEDSEGKRHTARSSSSSGGGGGSSASSGGNGVRSSGHSGSTGETRPLALYHLRFAPLRQGVTPRKIVCTVSELLGKPQRITFQFNDLALP